MDMTLPIAPGGACVWRGKDDTALAYLRVMSHYMSCPLTFSEDSDRSDDEVCLMYRPTPEEGKKVEIFWPYGVGTRFVRGRFEVMLRRVGLGDGMTPGFVYRQIFHLGMLPGLSGDRVLAHGVLAQFRDEGCLICGASGMGKSTLARRLGGAWKVWSDDCVLLGKDGEGEYFAQPVPTWSLWYADDPPPPRVFDCRRVVPLKRVFLLTRGPAALVSRLTRRSGFMAEATDSIMTFADIATASLPAEFRRRILQLTFDFGYKMAEKLPFYRLIAPLDREFQGEMEKLYGR